MYLGLPEIDLIQNSTEGLFDLFGEGHGEGLVLLNRLDHVMLGKDGPAIINTPNRGA